MKPPRLDYRKRCACCEESRPRKTTRNQASPPPSRGGLSRGKPPARSRPRGLGGGAREAPRLVGTITKQKNCSQNSMQCCCAVCASLYYRCFTKGLTMRLPTQYSTPRAPSPRARQLDVQGEGFSLKNDLVSISSFFTTFCSLVDVLLYCIPQRAKRNKPTTDGALVLVLLLVYCGRNKLDFQLNGRIQASKSPGHISPPQQ